MSIVQFYRNPYFYLLRLSKSPAAAAYIKLTIVSPLLSYKTLLGFSLLTNLVELSYLNSNIQKWWIVFTMNYSNNKKFTKHLKIIWVTYGNWKLWPILHRRLNLGQNFHTDRYLANKYWFPLYSAKPSSLFQLCLIFREVLPVLMRVTKCNAFCIRRYNLEFYKTIKPSRSLSNYLESKLTRVLIEAATM